MSIEEMKRLVNTPISERERFVLRLGKFGMYIYDCMEKKDVDLQQTIDVMNKADRGIHSLKKLFHLIPAGDKWGQNLRGIIDEMEESK